MKKYFYFSILFFLALNAAGQNYITTMEYWFDTAYSANVSQSTLPVQQLDVNYSISTTGLAKGLHTFNIRFQQTSGFWSETMSNYFFKTGESNSSLPLIDAYRYRVDGIDSVVTVNLGTPVSPFDIVAALDLHWVHRGSNYLIMQFRDEQGNWSVATVDSFFKSSIPVADFSAIDTFVCNIDSVHFINKSNDADIFLWHYGDGDSSTDVQPVHHYVLPGDYTVSLTATDTALGKDSTVTYVQYIHVMHSAQASFTYTNTNLQFTFTNTSLYANTSYWDFGDGAHSTATSPLHTYQHDGNYTIVLTVTDSCTSYTDSVQVSLVLGLAGIEADEQISISYDNYNAKISFFENAKNCSYTLLNPAGQILFSGRDENILSGFTKEISLSNFAAGFYLLQLNNEKTNKVKVIYKY